MNDCKLETEEQTASMENNTPIKPYFKPCLEELGDLRALTLGASPGLLESGTPPHKDPFLEP